MWEAQQALCPMRGVRAGRASSVSRRFLQCTCAMSQTEALTWITGSCRLFTFSQRTVQYGQPYEALRLEGHPSVIDSPRMLFTGGELELTQRARARWRLWLALAIVYCVPVVLCVGALAPGEENALRAAKPGDVVHIGEILRIRRDLPDLPVEIVGE